MRKKGLEKEGDKGKGESDEDEEVSPRHSWSGHGAPAHVHVQRANPRDLDMDNGGGVFDCARHAAVPALSSSCVGCLGRRARAYPVRGARGEARASHSAQLLPIAHVGRLGLMGPPGGARDAMGRLNSRVCGELPQGGGK
eukprot:scaffold166684_cov39-Tisochrysis_lutea.AAC.3